METRRLGSSRFMSGFILGVNEFSLSRQTEYYRSSVNLVPDQESYEGETADPYIRIPDKTVYSGGLHQKAAVS
ncbi:MAG: hypothetical protein JRF57_15185 [Deltaproteobacteria bacterium]|nr:hypothetical protein [Deltaproteobacteria bacterium]MBW2305046.1 hypothetical protein [Deltaproteobacteria bacterium]